MKASLYSQQDLDEPVHIVLERGELVLYSKRSPLKTTSNEDACAVYEIDPDTYVFTVADGMGGLPQGQQASATVVQSLAQSLKSKTDSESCREEILNGLEQANKKILASASGAGSTVAIAEILHDTVRPYHIGDAKILILGQRGKLKLQTLSHSPTEYAIEAGYLDHDEALDHEDRHYVTNMIGSEEMRIELGTPVKLNRFDTLVLSSDGLIDNLHLEEIIEITRKGSLNLAMQNLVSLCLERMQGKSSPSAPDDLSIILYRQNTPNEKSRQATKSD